MKKIVTSLLLLALPGCAWFQAHPQVQTAAEQCTSCVGAAVVANYTSPSPVPFYPQLCTEMLAECGSTCGSDIATIISAVAGSADPSVQATPAFREATARRSSMLAK
jgi:hypothetical protein